MSPQPLENVRVLDVSHVIAGPFATMLLANAGAEVIKVEPPVTGERTRRSGHPIAGEEGETVSLQFVRVNRGKKGVTLNLREIEGKEIFRRLANVSDVVVENFRPGVMDRLGLGYETLKRDNPRLIYATISGYGRREDLRGPYSDWPANNPAAQAMSGLMDVTGDHDAPPSMVGASIGDTIPAIWTAYGIMLALAQRALTGEGQFLDVAMYDVLVMHNDVAIPFYDLYGRISGRNREDMWSPQLRLVTSDGFVVISGGVPTETWVKLWRAAGREDVIDDPRYIGKELKGPFMLQVVKPALEEWTRTRRKRELCDFLIDIGFSASMVQNAGEVYGCVHLKHRQMFHEFDYAGRHFRMPGNPAKLSASSDDEGRPPPRLGQHNNDVYGSLLGMDEAELCSLRAKGVI